MFEKRDFEQFKLLGISAEKVENQIESIKRGFPFLKIVSPATKERGILIIEEDEKKAVYKKIQIFQPENLKICPSIRSRNKNV